METAQNGHPFFGARADLTALADALLILQFATDKIDKFTA